MIKYYKLFDLLNRRNMNKSDLLEIISSKTIAKLSKGANLNTDVIDKICLFLNCQPSDIMEVIEIENIDDVHNSRIIYKDILVDEETEETHKIVIGETRNLTDDFEIEREVSILAEEKIDIKKK